MDGANHTFLCKKPLLKVYFSVPCYYRLSINSYLVCRNSQSAVLTNNLLSFEWVRQVRLVVGRFSGH
jgi:hypothetical protein